MKLIKIGTILFKVSALACLIMQTNSAIAGSVNVCTGSGTVTGTNSSASPAFSGGCTNNTGISLLEYNDGGMSDENRAKIGLGMDNNGKNSGTVYIAGIQTVIDSVTSLTNHQIKELANATEDGDAVNLGQVKDLAASTLSESKTYTDTAKADAIAQGKIYTDQEVNKLSDQVIHYDLNADGIPNKNAVTLAGGSNGTTLSNVANGQVNANSKDAVNGSQLNVTNQALADYLGGGAEYNTTTQSFTAPTFKVGNANYNNVGDAVTALDYRLDGLSGQVNSLKDQLEQGLAMSAAMAGLFQPYGVGKFNVSVAGGGYGSQGAIAVGSGFRFNENTAIKAGMAAIPGKGKASYNMGVNFEW